MLAVLDTNALVADFRLAGTQFQLLFGAMRLTGLHVAIPELVVDETVRRYSETLSDVIKSLDKAARQLSRLVNVPQNENSFTDVAKATAEYEVYLRTTLKEIGVRILEYPSPTHFDVVKRELARRKPFGGVSGYRDFLIWTSVLNVLFVGQELVVFVTENARDFAEGDDLHPDLLADLDRIHVDRSRVTLARGLRKFNEIYTIPHLKRADDLRDDLQRRSGVTVDLYEWLIEHISELLEGEDLLYYGLDIERYGSASIRALVQPPILDVTDVYETSPGTYVVKFAAIVELEYHVSFDWEDFVDSAAVRDYLGVSESFAFASTEETSSFRIDIDVTIGGSPTSVLSWDVQSVGSGN